MWWPFIQSLGGNEKMEVVGINVKTSEMDPFFVRFVDVFRCHRLSWKVHKTCGLPQLLFLATKIHRFNHWGCGDEWRNDVILLVAILANSYQKWTRRVVLVWGKNQQTPWHNNWYNCKVAKYYQRGTGVSFLLQTAVFFHDSYLTGRLQRQQGNVKGKQMAALSSWALMGSFFVLTLQRRKAVQTSWVLCYNYTWWSIEYMFVSLKAFFLRSQVMSKVFHTKAEATTSREVPFDLFFWCSNHV